MKRKSLVALAALLLVACLGALWFAGNALSSPAPKVIGALPDDLNGSSIQFQSYSGETIHGWYIPGRRGAGAVALMHGVRSNRLSMLDRARFLSQAGYSVLLFDFQAHGESTGKHITFGYLESEDAAAAIAYLKQVAPGERIGVIGVSMGGAAATLAAPPLSINALVLEMVYPTIKEAVDDRLTMRLGGWARVLTPLLLLQSRAQLGFSSNNLRPIDHVGQLTFPKLFIAGANDRHTTLDESRRLFEAASSPKDFWVVPGAAHVDLHGASKVEYEQRVLEFLRSNLR
ncbi:MAG TPA: alpha/beta hydrolase [Pyrinomonadaceae bacterium]